MDLAAWIMSPDQVATWTTVYTRGQYFHFWFGVV